MRWQLGFLNVILHFPITQLRDMKPKSTKATKPKAIAAFAEIPALMAAIVVMPKIDAAAAQKLKKATSNSPTTTTDLGTMLSPVWKQFLQYCIAPAKIPIQTMLAMTPIAPLALKGLFQSNGNEFTKYIDSGAIKDINPTSNVGIVR